MRRFTRQIRSGLARFQATLGVPTILLSVLCSAVSFACSQINIQSKDGYVRREGSGWVLGTSAAEKRIRLKDGQLVLASLINKQSGHEYHDASSGPPEISFVLNSQDVTAPNWNWSLLNEKAVVGKQGEIQLDIGLTCAGIHAIKHYVVYPGTPVIREWLTIENARSEAIRISQVDFLHTRVLSSSPRDLGFNYLTGGGNFNGSQLLKSEPMSPAYQRILDSNGGIQAGELQRIPPPGFSAPFKCG